MAPPCHSVYEVRNIVKQWWWGRREMTEEAPTRSTHWILSLRAVAVVMAVFGFSCLTVLIVVTAVDSENALATVALALAVLAFTVQLIVFVAQHGMAGEQGRRNEELHGSMQGVLAEISEKTAGTQLDVRRMSDRSERMSEAILSKNFADAQGGRVDYRRLASDLNRTVDESDGDAQAAPQEDDFWPARQIRPNDEAVVHQLQTFPEADDVGDSLTMLKDLSSDARQRLKSFGDDEARARKPGYLLDPALLEEESSELEKQGLIEPHPGSANLPERRDGFMRLTEDGREVARLLTARGDPPEYLPGLKQIRDETPDLYPAWQADRE